MPDACLVLEAVPIGLNGRAGFVCELICLNCLECRQQGEARKKNGGGDDDWSVDDDDDVSSACDLPVRANAVRPASAMKEVTA